MFLPSLFPVRLFQANSATMQHEVSTATPPVFLLCKRRPSLSDSPPHNFAETLPAEMSVKIFGELDAESLCSASCTCKLWHDIIEESDQLWRRQCLLARAVCQREVDRDRTNGLSWKVGSVTKDKTSDHVKVLVSFVLLMKTPAPRHPS